MSISYQNRLNARRKIRNKLEKNKERGQVFQDKIIAEKKAKANLSQAMFKKPEFQSMKIKKSNKGLVQKLKDLFKRKIKK